MLYLIVGIISLVVSALLSGLYILQKTMWVRCDRHLRPLNVFQITFNRLRLKAFISLNLAAIANVVITHSISYVTIRLGASEPC